MGLTIDLVLFSSAIGTTWLRSSEKEADGIQYCSPCRDTIESGDGRSKLGESSKSNKFVRITAFSKYLQKSHVSVDQAEIFLSREQDNTFGGGAGKS